MKRSCIFFISLFVCVSQAFSLEFVAEPGSKLTRVVLFTDRAMVQKEAPVSLKQGENLIRFQGLPASLVDGSVQAEVTGRKDIRISGVKVSDTRLSNAEPSGVTQLRKRSEALHRQLADLRSQAEIIRSSGEFLKKVVPFPSGQRVTESEIETHLKYLERSLSENSRRVALLEEQQLRLQEEIQKVDAELGELLRQTEQSKTLEVALFSPGVAEGVVLRFSYVTYQAGWNPLYEARADLVASKVQIAFFASVTQSTGEDWEDAEVEISTSQPFVYATIPELHPWYIDQYVNRPVALRMGIAEKSVMAVADAAGGAADEQFYAGPEVTEESASFRFVLPRKASIPSDGETHNLSLAQSEQEAEFTYYAIPKRVQSAFLKAKLKNPFAFPLIPGAVNLYLDGKLSGNAMIREAVVAQGNLELALGTDESLQVERKLEKKDTGYAGLLSKEKSVEYAYQITVTNGKSKEITLLLEDQFPVSQNEKIKVVQIRPNGSDAQIDDKGKIVWTISLNPGQKKVVPLSFRVEYAQDLSVQGLE